MESSYLKDRIRYRKDQNRFPSRGWCETDNLPRSYCCKELCRIRKMGVYFRLLSICIYLCHRKEKEKEEEKEKTNMWMCLRIIIERSGICLVYKQNSHQYPRWSLYPVFPWTVINNPVFNLFSILLHMINIGLVFTVQEMESVLYNLLQDNTNKSCS